jgi:NAD(P)-dependent dehydrogenase (short-subunit alcohol dehydrogenase family)
MGRLKGKVTIITGASSGIGRATALLFAAEGARLVVGARRASELEHLVAQIGAQQGEAVELAGDVRSEDYARALVMTAVERFGRLDIAFNNAGTLGESGPSTGISEAGWSNAIAVNLTGSFLGAKHQLAQMVKQCSGSLIFTSTFVGYSSAFPGVAAYAASKSGLIGLTQALAAEFGPQGIRVNAILPGGVDTDMYREMNDTPESQAFIIGLHALKRVATPEELARSVLYLASDEASFVTGTAMLVDGGVSITRT